MMSASQFRIAAALALLSAAAGAQSNDTATSSELAGSRAILGPIAQPASGGSYSALLHDNGGFTTQTGVGAGGSDVSEIELGFGTFGFGHAVSAGIRVADDFTVPAGSSWTLSSLKWYGYQTGSTTTSTFTEVRVQIWSGSPAAGGVVIAGDTTTNRLLTSTFSNVYRVTTAALTSSSRPIMENVADLSFCPTLPAGTYYVDVSCAGSLASGPWANPTVPHGAGDNALQFITAWNPLLDATAGLVQDLPFKLEGSACSGPLSETNSTPGALVPASGSGDGTWPGTLPSAPTSLSVTTSCPINCIDKITLNNPTHSWAGDTQFVLEDPSGVQHNLLVRPGFTGSGFGNSGDFVGGQIVLVDPTTLGAASIPTSGNIAAGTYAQSFGGGGLAAGTVNTPLRLISGPAGTWTLKVYDWASGDTGAIDGFTLDANTCNYTASTYCVAKVNSLGCTPAIAFAGSASATATSGFVISASNIRNNKNGLLFYGNTGPNNAPFQGGTLCVNPPIRRTGVQNSFGSGPAVQDCSGTFAIDMNTYASTASAPFLTTVGSAVYCQFWSRDPGFTAPNNTNLTDAVQYYVGN